MSAAGISELLAGTARVNITPKEPISMGGYGQRAGSVSQGVHDSLFAKALYLKYGRESRLLLITTDLISLPDAIYERVKKGLVEAGVIEDTSLCITASHTHSGPDVEESLIIASTTRAYLDWLVEKLVLVGKQAATSPVLVQIKKAVGQVDFLVNRRQMGKDNLVDRRVLAIELDHAGTGQPLAIVFGVGCHAVCLGHDNMLISADYPGYAQRVIEEGLGAECALFVNLAEGNVIPDTRPLFDSLDTRGYLGGTFTDAKKTGTALGLEVIRCLREAKPERVDILQVGKSTVTVRPTRYQLSLWAAWKKLLAQRRIIFEYLPEFRKVSIFNLRPVFTLWRDASAVVVGKSMSEDEMRRLMSAVSTFLMMAMKITNPALRKMVPFDVQTIRLNDFIFMTLPGEVLVEVSHSWQERNTPHSDTAFVLGLANGFKGYLPHPSNFLEERSEYKYETIMNALEPEATRIALDRAEQMVKR